MVELADVFRRHGPQYRAKFGHKMLPSHLQAMRAIERCRTPALGGHVYLCTDCGETVYHYHSCRNRHCPKCQNGKAYRWLEKQRDLLLPVPYFLLTFTLPHDLRQIARSNQRLFYHLLFRASSEATQCLARDPRFVGGQVGMVGVLQTWGRNLSYHPHVHYLVPAGGLAADGQTWLPASKKFLLPVKALSKIFRAKFRDALRKTDCFADVPADVWKKPWIVHCLPVGNGLSALKYLAPYIFRVAISNRNILELADGKVTFRYHDSDTGKLKICTLPVEEFIRRFLQHVLPKGFVKVRYSGFFAPGCRPRLAIIRQQLDDTSDTPLSSLPPNALDLDDTDAQEEFSSDETTADSPVLCPSCGQSMQRQPIPKERPP